MRTLLLAALAATLASAQQRPTPVYRLDITLRETDEKNQVSDRQYMALVENHGWGRFNLNPAVDAVCDHSLMVVAR